MFVIQARARSFSREHASSGQDFFSDPGFELNRFENLVGDCHREGDTELARVNNALDFQFAESIDELVAKISGGRNDADFRDAETQDDFLILAPDIEQVDVGKDAVLGGHREAHGQSNG
jgi:hypothetical protein